MQQYFEVANEGHLVRLARNSTEQKHASQPRHQTHTEAQPVRKNAGKHFADNSGLQPVDFIESVLAYWETDRTNQAAQTQNDLSH